MPAPGPSRRWAVQAAAVTGRRGWDKMAKNVEA